MSLHPTFTYRDARGAIAWLERAFDLTVKEIHDAPDGTVAHAELHAGGGILMLGTEANAPEPLRGRAGRHSVYVGLDDVAAVHERAVAAGAEVVRPLADTDYGSREFSALDPEGNWWSFGTYQPS
jgi:uncharacterized glyoxalase superfamily protein PhnB